MAMNYYILFMLWLVCCICGELCPKQCDCDMDNGLNRASCHNQNIINVYVGVPKSVQVYSLSYNAITELENYCFKDIGYSSLKILSLSYNLIYWIGIHAFAGLDELKELDLSNNRLRYIPSDLLWDTPQLDILDLSGNVFETLKNEPFLIQEKLQVLNLQSCRIKAFPNRIFNRLPNLKKLDLSDNYVITFSTEVLQPLHKLTKLELRNDYLKCTKEFKEVEDWILSHDISYTKYCRNLPRMSEKIISAVFENDPVDVNEVWNVTVMPKENITIPVDTNRTMTTLEKFDKNFSAIQALIIGLEIGLGIGIVGTYLWLSKFCTVRLRCTRPQTARQTRRAQRRGEADLRASLLWTSVTNPDLETPPQLRRELSLPDGPVSFRAYRVAVDTVRLPDRSETPPPPYNECRFNI